MEETQAPAEDGIPGICLPCNKLTLWSGVFEMFWSVADSLAQIGQLCSSRLHGSTCPCATVVQCTVT